VELPLAGELLAEDMEIGDQSRASLKQRFLGGGLVVRLHAQIELGKQRVRDLVGGEDDVLVLQQGSAEEVTESVVLAVEGEDRGVRLARVRLHRDLGLAVGEEEELETGVDDGVSMRHGRDLRRGTSGGKNRSAAFDMAKVYSRVDACR
jgi:hypothetical protein